MSKRQSPLLAKQYAANVRHFKKTYVDEPESPEVVRQRSRERKDDYPPSVRFFERKNHLKYIARARGPEAAEQARFFMERFLGR